MAEGKEMDYRSIRVSFTLNPMGSSVASVPPPSSLDWQLHVQAEPATVTVRHTFSGDPPFRVETHRLVPQC